jgi:hypothetical protein
LKTLGLRATIRLTGKAMGNSVVEIGEDRDKTQNHANLAQGRRSGVEKRCVCVRVCSAEALEPSIQASNSPLGALAHPGRLLQLQLAI